jgi:hypothetical protein
MKTAKKTRLSPPVLVLSVFAFIVWCGSAAYAQGESALPFVLFGSSADANGMGDVAGSVPSLTATAPLANPGQLGLLSLENVFSGAVYPEKTQWNPAFYRPNPSYTATAFNLGYNFKDLLSLPIPVSIGVGYSRAVFRYGTFVFTSPSNPAGEQSFDPEETSTQFTIGLGLDYLVHVGVGVGFKSIESRLGLVSGASGVQEAIAKVPARDFGLIVVAPVTDIVSTLADTKLDLLPRIEPLLDLSFGYVHGNHGGEVRYTDAGQPDPLPRKATLGAGVEIGFAAKIRESRWRIATIMLSHEAEDILIIRANDGTFSYQDGLGDIKFMENVIQGKMNPKATVRKGWQLQVGEIVFVRGGHVAGPGRVYETDGFGVSINGIFRFLEFALPELSGGWIGFAGEHFDFQYNTSRYEGMTSFNAGTTFKQLNLVIKKLPF